MTTPATAAPWPAQGAVPYDDALKAYIDAQVRAAAAASPEFDVVGLTAPVPIPVAGVSTGAPVALYTAPAGKFGLCEWFGVRNQTATGQSNLYVSNAGEAAGPGAGQAQGSANVVQSINVSSGAGTGTPILVAPGQTLWVQAANGADVRFRGVVREYALADGFVPFRQGVPAGATNQVLYTCPAGKIALTTFLIKGGWNGLVAAYNQGGANVPYSLTAGAANTTVATGSVGAYSTMAGMVGDWGLTAGESLKITNTGASTLNVWGLMQERPA